MPVNSSAEERLTDTKGLDDGPEYTPDGKWIYFDSMRSGSMQIWRVKPDEKWIAFISFLKEEVDAGSHPPYKHAYIRMMPFESGKPKGLAYVYEVREARIRRYGRRTVSGWRL